MPSGGGDRGDEAEREHVARRGHFAAGALLGRHELRGADEAAAACEAGGLGCPGDAEVDDPRPVGGEQDVARLEVAVDHSRRVHRVQGAGDAGDELEGGGQGQRTVDVQGLVQGQPGYVCAGQPRLLAVRVVVEHRHEVVAADLLGGPDLLLEAVPELAVARVLTADHLECDGLVAPRAGQVHGTHAALADPGEQPVPGQLPWFLCRQWAKDTFGSHGGTHPRMPRSSCRIPVLDAVMFKISIVAADAYGPGPHPGRGDGPTAFRRRGVPASGSGCARRYRPWPPGAESPRRAAAAGPP